MVPEKAALLLDQLGIADNARSFASFDEPAWFDGLVTSGFTIAKPTPIFPRLELPETEDA